MMQTNRFFFSLLILIILATPNFGQTIKDANCFSMLAGREVSLDGSVMIAHNEDDWGDLYVDWHKVPRIQHEKGSMLTIEKGGQLAQVDETYSFFWMQMPGMQFSDSYMNEWGLTIASNQCRSREDQPDLTDGGIGFYLRRIMTERAKTAREAVEIGGQLVEKFGYHYSGRTYLVADSKEAWMMSVVQGKHWIAQRVPDDHIAIIPNYYTIQEIDLTDTANFLGSKDIITYAIKRGWFKTDTGERFNFRKIYGDPETLHGIWNIPRHMAAINHFSESAYNYYDNFPFSFQPKSKISHVDIMEIMGTHGEGTQFEISPNYNLGNPHDTEIKRVCSGGNQYGFVAQLRDNGLPAPIAHVMWLAPKRPCIQAFTPWYVGITEIPENFSRDNPRTCLAKHFKEEDLKSKTAGKAYWRFKEFADSCDKNYTVLSTPMKTFKATFQKSILQQQPVFEEVFVQAYNTDEEKALQILNNYVGGLALKILEHTEKSLKGIQPEN
jgi:dipeptidase